MADRSSSSSSSSRPRDVDREVAGTQTKATDEDQDRAPPDQERTDHEETETPFSDHEKTDKEGRGGGGMHHSHQQGSREFPHFPYRISCSRTFLQMKYRTYRMVWVPRRRVKSEPALPVSQVLSEFGHRVEKPDSDDEEQGQPDTFVKSLRSVGSLYHQPGGNCKSRKCFWFFSRKGCDRGWLCPHCHYCAPMGGAPEARVDPIKSPSISSMFLHVPPQRGVPVGVGGVGGSGQTRIDVHRGSHQSSSSSSSSSGGAGASGTQRSVRDQERIRGLHWGRREGVRGLSSTLPPFSSIGPLTGPIGSSGRSAERGRGSASRSERGLEGDGTERERGREGRQTEEEEEGVSLSPTLRDPPHRFHAISPPARAASSAAAVAPVRPTSSSSRSAFLTDTRGIALPFRASPALPGDGLSWRSQIPGAPAEGVQTEGAPSPRPSPSEASSPFHSPSPSPKSLSKHGRRRG